MYNRSFFILFFLNLFMDEKSKNAILVLVITALAILGLIILLFYAPNKKTGEGYTALRTITRAHIPETSHSTGPLLLSALPQISPSLLLLHT